MQHRVGFAPQNYPRGGGSGGVVNPHRHRVGPGWTETGSSHRSDQGGRPPPRNGDRPGARCPVPPPLRSGNGQPPPPQPGATGEATGSVLSPNELRLCISPSTNISPGGVGGAAERPAPVAHRPSRPTGVLRGSGPSLPAPGGAGEGRRRPGLHVGHPKSCCRLRKNHSRGIIPCPGKRPSGPGPAPPAPPGTGGDPVVVSPRRRGCGGVYFGSLITF